MLKFLRGSGPPKDMGAVNMGAVNKLSRSLVLVYVVTLLICDYLGMPKYQLLGLFVILLSFGAIMERLLILSMAIDKIGSNQQQNIEQIEHLEERILEYAREIDVGVANLLRRTAPPKPPWDGWPFDKTGSQNPTQP